MTNLSVNPDRLWQSLMEHAEIGALPDGGICRETLTDLDRLGRDLFSRWCEAIGMQVAIDELGNMYATRSGSEPDLEPIAIGSHLDTQPTGGKFDGILGVLAGLEVVRTLNDAGIVTRRPITLVNWTNEEGSRFHPSMAASGVYSGIFPLSDAENWVDRNGIRFLDELKRIGYLGSEKVGARKFSAYLELHIEQGPILDAENVQIGVVSGVQAMSFNRVFIRGEERHAGTTPMDLRKDPVAAFTRIASKCFQLGESIADARVTIGSIDAQPGSHSTIPHLVDFTLDLRHPDPAILAKMIAAYEEAVMEEQARGLVIEREEFGVVEAQDFNPECVNAIRQAAVECGYTHKDIITGAGHDAVYVARICPVGMIFVPCREGISHSPKESIEPVEAAAGANVLLKATLALADAV